MVPLSRKNHKIIDGQLLQTDKKYTHLKLKQKDKIAEWMYLETLAYYEKNYVFPDDKHLDEVVFKVYGRIEDADIWIPYGEVLRHYRKKRRDINKRVRKTLNQHEDREPDPVCFMNMCMIYDEKGNVLALDKENDSYTGTTFPGGHVEKGEVFQESIIREIREETGLEIKNPQLCGMYHWIRSGVHNVLFLYKTNEFSGFLKSSEEGQVYWISLEGFKQKELATGMEYVLQILESSRTNECYMHLEKGKYVGTLY
ncbi:NUDIX domain-containing protein [Roseburia hominis]